MNEAPRKTTVTLEDLLRLKRAEQPPAEFWAEFERGLRTKQLAAIVEPRPWWAPLIRVGTRLSRYQVPVGATAILALTLLTIRGYHPTNSPTAFEPATAESASLAAPASAPSTASAMESVSAPAGPSTAMVAVVTEPAPAPVTPAAHTVPAAPAATAALGAASHVAMVNSELTSARYMADNLAAAQPSDPELDQMLGRAVRGSDSGPVRADPLAQISVPGESRSRRLLAGMAWSASASSGDSALRMNEQSARHLSERRLSESDVVSRLDVGGNRLTVKF
jgi:hypothetical protein